MSLATEIAGNQTRIAAAQAEERMRRQISQPRYTELPDGFYNSRQLAIYQRADGTITDTTAVFMGELNPPTYSLTREFIITRPNTSRLLGGPTKDMYYHLNIGGHDEQMERYVLRYHPGDGEYENLTLRRRGIPVLVPERKIGDDNFEVGQLLNWLRSPEATRVIYPLVGINIVSVGSVRALLTLIVSNPSFNFLVPAEVR